MAKYINENFYRNAYMLEFRNGETVQDVFTFSVPPQNEEFDSPQRINETKTFGGSVIDDYGNDTQKITLSGTTGNPEKKIIYCGNKGRKHKTGEEEAIMLQKLLEEYGKYSKLNGKKVYLYRLNNSVSTVTSEFWWRVNIQDFSIKRSKDNPLFYSYTITMIGYKPDTIVTELTFLTNMLAGIKDLCQKIDNLVDKLEKGLSYVRAGADIVATIRIGTKAVLQKVEDIENVLTGYIDAVTDAVDETKSLAKDVFSHTRRIVGASVDFVNSAGILYQASKDLCDFVASFGSGDNQINISFWESTGKEFTEIFDIWTNTARDIEDCTNEVIATSRRIGDKYSFAVIPGDETTDDRAIQIYGYKFLTLSEGQSWDSLARQYYGSAEYGSLISTFNSMSGYKPKLEAGNKILIPLLKDTVNGEQNNEIFNVAGEKDNMGKDVAISESGDLKVKSGDIDVTSEEDTLAQSLLARLTTDITSRCRQVAYGIRPDIGSPVLNTYILASIQETIEADPRVLTVEEITYVGKGDKLDIKVNYTDINGIKQNFAGQI